MGSWVERGRSGWAGRLGISAATRFRHAAHAQAQWAGRGGAAAPSCAKCRGAATRAGVASYLTRSLSFREIYLTKVTISDFYDNECTYYGPSLKYETKVGYKVFPIKLPAYLPSLICVCFHYIKNACEIFDRKMLTNLLCGLSKFT